MVDTHSHIYLPDFDDDLPEVLSRAAEKGVTDICMPAIDFSSLQQMESMHHPDIRFHKMAGIHPCEIKGKLDDALSKKLKERASQSDIIGIGETGLDYYWSTDYVEEQKESLRLHCSISKEFKKPIVLHNRESTDDLLDIIESEQDGNLDGIWHCFNGSVDEGKRAIDMGLHLGIGGVVTFKNAGVDKAVAQLPLEKMVLETDAPYLTPTPHRGKRNEPAYIHFVLLKLAELFELEPKVIRSKTSETAKNLFGF